MEDVWKDITLSSLHHHPSSSTSTSSSSASETATSFRGMVLKDFLSTSPFLNDPPPPPTATPAAAFTSPASMFACPSPTIAAPQPHHPATILSLNSTPEFHFLDAGHHTDHLQGNLVPNFSAPFDAFSSSPFLSSFGKRSGDLEAGSGDRRHKRMIKNRESAARSRARKQAYINELEQEVAQLMEENTRLRRQQQQLHHIQEPQTLLQHLPKKKQQQQQQRLQRTLTAPF